MVDCVGADVTVLLLNHRTRSKPRLKSVLINSIDSSPTLPLHIRPIIAELIALNKFNPKINTKGREKITLRYQQLLLKIYTGKIYQYVLSYCYTFHCKQMKTESMCAGLKTQYTYSQQHYKRCLL